MDRIGSTNKALTTNLHVENECKLGITLKKVHFQIF